MKEKKHENFMRKYEEKKNKFYPPFMAGANTGTGRKKS